MFGVYKSNKNNFLLNRWYNNPQIIICNETFNLEILVEPLIKNINHYENIMYYIKMKNAYFTDDEDIINYNNNYNYFKSSITYILSLLKGIKCNIYLFYNRYFFRNKMSNNKKILNKGYIVLYISNKNYFKDKICLKYTSKHKIHKYIRNSEIIKYVKNPYDICYYLIDKFLQYNNNKELKTIYNNINTEIYKLNGIKIYNLKWAWIILHLYYINKL